MHADLGADTDEHAAAAAAAIVMDGKGRERPVNRWRQRQAVARTTGSGWERGVQYFFLYLLQFKKSRASDMWL